MIVINGITDIFGTYPERLLTPEENLTVIGMWYFNDAYRYFQVEDAAELKAREDALALLTQDIARNNQIGRAHV